MTSPKPDYDKYMLDAPFRDKDIVKRLGARWDPSLRRWFITSAADLEQFQRWKPTLVSPRLEEPNHLTMHEEHLIDAGDLAILREAGVI